MIIIMHRYGHRGGQYPDGERRKLSFGGSGHMPNEYNECLEHVDQHSQHIVHKQRQYYKGGDGDDVSLVM
jgi:hypothetical protein